MLDASSVPAVSERLNSLWTDSTVTPALLVRKTQLEADQIAAQQIQKRLHPEKLEQLAGYETEVFYQPCRAVGGDRRSRRPKKYQNCFSVLRRKLASARLVTTHENNWAPLGAINRGFDPFHEAINTRAPPLTWHRMKSQAICHHSKIRGRLFTSYSGRYGQLFWDNGIGTVDRNSKQLTVRVSEQVVTAARPVRRFE